jgi:transposase
VRRARVLWAEKRQAWDCGRLVFIDESGAKTNLTRRRGRAARGCRVYDATPHGHWCVRTMISSVRADGTTACMSVDSATDRDVFTAYVRAVLVPTLRPGDIVVLDNLAAHKHSMAAELIGQAGATVEYLPPYSPDLNPIEKMWSKIKEFLRAAKARTSQALHKAITAAFLTISTADALAWFASCGYTIS